MICKWDILDNVNPSFISLADCLGKCNCPKCTRERKKDNELDKLRKENKRLKKNS